MTKVTNDLAGRIMAYRAKHDLSGAEFAKLCKITPQTLYNVANGIQNPSKFTREKIEIVLRGEQVN